MREEPRSPPEVAAGADWAKADEMNTVILQIQATGDCMRLGFLNTEAWSLQELVIAGQVLAIARQELVIARSVATKQSDEASRQKTAHEAGRPQPTLCKHGGEAEPAQAP